MKFLRDNFLWILSAFSSLMLILGLMYNTFIPSWISFILGAVAVIFLVISKIKFSNTLKLFIVFSLLTVVGFLFYSQYTADRLIKYNPSETSIITFVVLKDSPIVKIEDTQNMKFGSSVMMEEITTLFLKDQLDSKKISYKWNTMPDDQTNLDNLYSGSIDVMVLDNSVRDYLKEQNPDFESKTKIIWTVEKSSVKEVIVKEVDISKKPFIVLISGIDINGPITMRSRSDVNILMIINPTSNKILTISIPRDTYAPLGCKTGALDKLTHSGIYGINCTVKTIENLFGVDINYYVRVNFTSFLKIINVIGNVNVYSKYSFSTSSGFSFIAGMNSLNAERALIFARERHSFASGDIQRGLNQQEVIKAVFNKLVQPSSLLKIEGIIKSTGKSVDTNMPLSDISKLVKKQIENNKPWIFQTSNLSGTGDMQPTYSMGSRLLYVMHPNQASLTLLKQNIEAMMIVAN
jgi:LCP family protein required for cell wall assembly